MTSRNSAKAARAPWRDAFLSHVDKMASPTFVLASLHSASSEQLQSSSSLLTDATSSITTHFEPRARTVVYRGMWAALPVNPKNKATLNPALYQAELPTITTDARMEKVSDLFSTSVDKTQSAVGGPVEALFWIPEARTQWRLRGSVYMIGQDIDSQQGLVVREALKPYMRESGAEKDGSSDDSSSWSWSRELTAQFGNLSPVMRGTFRNPSPGTPISQKPKDGEGLGLGQNVEDLDDPVARSNFRVIVLVPDEVDRVDLSNPEEGKRWIYRLNWKGGEGSWSEEELWP